MNIKLTIESVQHSVTMLCTYMYVYFIYIYIRYILDMEMKELLRYDTLTINIEISNIIKDMSYTVKTKEYTIYISNICDVFELI